MNSEKIEPEELLYRAVPNKPQLWKSELNKPSSALFKDSMGVSVDRDGNRSQSDIIHFIKENIKGELKAIILIKAQECFKFNAYPLPKPISNNIYHAEIHDSETKISLTDSKAKQLSRACKIAIQY